MDATQRRILSWVRTHHGGRLAQVFSYEGSDCFYPSCFDPDAGWLPLEAPAPTLTLAQQAADRLAHVGCTNDGCSEWAVANDPPASASIIV